MLIHCRRLIAPIIAIRRLDNGISQLASKAHKYTAASSPNRRSNGKAIDEILENLRGRRTEIAVSQCNTLLANCRTQPPHISDMKHYFRLFAGFKRIVHPKSPLLVRSIVNTLERISPRAVETEPRIFLGLAQVNLINNNIKEALPFIDIIENLDRKSSQLQAAYMLLLRSYSSIGNMEQMESILSKIKSKGIAMNSSIYRALILGYKVARRTDQLLPLLERIRNDPDITDMDPVIYNSLISACSTSNCDLALQLFEKMKSDGVKPDAETYLMMIKAVVQDRQRPMYYAQNLLKEMRSNNLLTMDKSSCEIFSNIVTGYVVRNEANDADLFIDKLLHVAGFPKDVMSQPSELAKYKITDDDSKPRFTVYYSLLMYYNAKKQHDIGKALVQHLNFNRIEKPLYAHFVILELMKNSGDLEAARQELFAMFRNKLVKLNLEKGSFPMSVYSMQTLEIMHKSAQENGVQGMQSVLTEWKTFHQSLTPRNGIEKQPWHISFYDVAIKRYLDEKMFDKAVKMWSHMIANHDIANELSAFKLTQTIADLPVQKLAQTAGGLEKIVVGDQSVTLQDNNIDERTLKLVTDAAEQAKQLINAIQIKESQKLPKSPLETTVI